MASLDVELRKIREKLEVLNGDRGEAGMRAVRLSEMNAASGTLQRATTEARGAVVAVADQVSDNTADIIALESLVAIARGDITALETAVTNQGTLIANQGTLIADNTADILALGTVVTGLSNDINAQHTAAAAVTIAALTSANIAAPPTAADYNKIVADLAMLRTALVALKAAVDG